MVKTIKMQPDKYKQLVAKQDEPKKPERPPTLGESTQATNWETHMNAGHKIKHFAKIQDRRDGKGKEAIVNSPGQNQYFIAVRENFCAGYYYIWILCLTNGSDRINWRVNSGDLDFVDWDIPSEIMEPVQADTIPVK